MGVHQSGRCSCCIDTRPWAILRLIENCETRDGEHLDATVRAGTYGTARDRPRHLAASEEGYLADVAVSLSPTSDPLR